MYYLWKGDVNMKQVVNNILGKRKNFPDYYNKLVYEGDNIVDENGNVGVVEAIQNNSVLVNFGKGVGRESVDPGREKIKKGKRW
jgi:hypothetical protein